MTHVPTRFKRVILKTFSNEGDLLLCTAECAWTTCHPYLQMPLSFETVWNARQLDDAAIRLLKWAARKLWPTQNQTDLEQVVLRLLFDKPGLPDPELCTWVQANQHRLLQLVSRLLYWHQQVNVEGFVAIAKEAARLGWPIHFTRDLTEIDFSRLLSPPAPRQFWWSVRQNGCRVYQSNNIYDVRWAQGAKEQGFGGLHYSYDGSRLQEIGEEKLLSALIASLEPEHYRLCWLEAKVLHLQTMSVPERLIQRPLTVQQASSMLRRAQRYFEEVCQLKLKAGQSQQEDCSDASLMSGPTSRVQE